MDPVAAAPGGRGLASSAAAIRDLAFERRRRFAGGPAPAGAVDACCSLLSAGGALESPSLIVRCRIRGGEVATRVVVDKAISRWRLSDGFAPFASRALAGFGGDADVLLLLSDNLYPRPEALPELDARLAAVPFLRCDWSEASPLSLRMVPIPDFHIQQASYAEAFAAIGAVQATRPFATRRAKAFWRGSLSGPRHVTRDNFRGFPRYGLLEAARSHPAALDARLTNFRDIEPRDPDGSIRSHLVERFGEPSRHVPEPDMSAHKYLISMDGAVAAWRRVPVILASGSVLLMQHGWKQFFYPGLRPWEHYVPLRADVSDLPAKHRWLEDHPAEAEAIASAGRAFAARFLAPAAIEAYFADVVRGLAHPP